MDALLDNYGSSDSASGSGASPANSSDSAASSERSLDSAEARAQAAAARLRDFGESGGGGGGGPKKLALPSALDAFDEVGGPPAFLDPEATRKLPTALLTGRQGDAAAAAAAGAGSSRQQQPGPDADISRLAPKLKGADDEGRRGPAVIEGKAKRYRDDDGGQTYTAAQIAMLGGHVPSGGGGGADGGEAAAGKRAPGPSAPGPAPQQGEQQQRARGKPTPAMGVQDFMDKGLGGAQLPRKRQDRKEREQAKRAKGQSTHAEWKPEAWMVMRQQYD